MVLVVKMEQDGKDVVDMMELVTQEVVVLMDRLEDLVELGVNQVMLLE